MCLIIITVAVAVCVRKEIILNRAILMPDNIVVYLSNHETCPC